MYIYVYINIFIYMYMYESPKVTGEPITKIIDDQLDIKLEQLT